MIKTALKHWIYEVCIDKLFSSIVDNFGNVNEKLWIFKEGNTFSYIEYCYKKNQYAKFFNVEIDLFFDKLIGFRYKERWLTALAPNTGRKHVYDINSVPGKFLVSISDISDYAV